MTTLLPPRFLAFATVFLLAGLGGHAQHFGEAGSYGLSPSTSSGTEINTNYATGRIAPSLPLITLPGIAGGVTVGLQYQAGAGVKVNDVASEVGLGWALSGGGAITRDIKGFPDDSQYGWFISTPEYKNKIFMNNRQAASDNYPLRFYTAGEVVKYFKSSTGNVYTSPGGTQSYGAVAQATNMQTWLYPASQVSDYSQYAARRYSQYTISNPNTSTNIGTHEARYTGYFAPDNEPDVYTLTLPSGGLQFVFDPNGNPVPLQAQNIKIEPNLSSRTYSANGLLHEFKVTTSDGVQYYFGSPVGTSNFKESITTTTQVLEIPDVASKKDVTSACITKWHLRKIVYTSGEEINYAYTANKTYEVSTNNYLQQDWVFTALNGYRYYNSQNGLDLAHPWHVRTWQRRYTVRGSSNSVDAKQLLSITSAQGTLQYVYESAPRRDVGGTTNALSSLRLLNTQGELVKRLDFVQHYADYGRTVPNAMPYDRYHLLLDRIVDKGNGCAYTNLWQFTYNSNTFCRNAATKDYWGYLNSLTYPTDGTLVAPYATPVVINNSYSLSGRNRDASASFTQYMILESITSATGAVQSFAYQLHDDNIGFTSNNRNRAVGGLRIYQISKYDGVNHSNDITEEYTYRKANNATESSGVWGDVGMFAKLQVIHDDIDNTVGAPPDGPVNNRSVPTDEALRRMVPYCYYANGSNHSRVDYYYMLRSDASMYEYATDYIDYSSVTVNYGAKGKTRYEFTSWADAAHQDYTDPDTRQVGNNLNTCPNDPLNPTYRGRILPLPFSLDVRGLSLASTYNGSQIHTFDVSADFPRRSSRSAQRGLPLQVTQLTSSGVPVATTINEYAFSPTAAALPTVNALYAKPSLETFGFSQPFTYFQLYFYNQSSQWCPLTSSVDIIYNQNSGGDITKSVATKTVIDYDYASLFPNKVTKFNLAYTGPGTYTVPEKYYVTAFQRAQSAAFDGGTADLVTTAGILRNAGMTAPIIEEERYTTATLNSTLKVDHLGASLNEFQINNGHVVLYQTYVSPTVSSFSPATVTQSASSWTLTRDASYRLISTVTGYSAAALAVNTIGRNGIPQSTIWGYGRTLPIATVTNGTSVMGSTNTGLQATAGHTSFEEEGTNGIDSDGWLLPTPANIVTTEAKTGIRSAKYATSQSRFGLNKSLVLTPGVNQQGKMIFSCWAKVPTGSTAPISFLLVASSSLGGYKQQGPNAFEVVPGQDWKYCEFIVDLEDPTWGNAGTNRDLPLLLYLWIPSSSGELLLDEMRIHRADAQMQTFTYQPLVGKTSSTGADGRTTYFTYDSDNSPSLVLDHNRDVRSRTQSKVINEARLTADFSPGFGIAQRPVNFVPELSNCNSTFTWDFGDQTPVVSGAAQPHTYTSPGTYQVTLIASNTTKGVAKLTKAVSICGAFATSIDVVSGDLNIDCCTISGGNGAVSLNARIDNSQCYQAASYQWQQQTSTGNWVNMAGSTTADFFFNVPCGGTARFRCIIVATDGNTNEFDPAMTVITATGTNTTNGVQCSAGPNVFLPRF